MKLSHTVIYLTHSQAPKIIAHRHIKKDESTDISGVIM